MASRIWLGACHGYAHLEVTVGADVGQMALLSTALSLALRRHSIRADLHYLWR